MRVLITGISGFVGRHLARRLLDEGHDVGGIATEARNFQRIAFDQVDIGDADRLKEVISRQDPEVIIHLAGLAHVGESWRRPGDYQRVNFVGTLNLLDAAGVDGKDRKVLFASSAEVYGHVPEDQQPIREEQPLSPRSPYAMTKACAEEAALRAGGVVVRSFNAVGPGQPPRYALPSFAAQLVAIERGEQDPEIRVGDLSPQRDFLHVADAAAGYALLAEKGVPGTAYNLASGSTLSIGDCLNRLRTLSGVEAEVVVDPERIRPVDIPLMCGDASRLKALGWTLEHGTDKAFEEILERARA